MKQTRKVATFEKELKTTYIQYTSTTSNEIMQEC